MTTNNETGGYSEFSMDRRNRKTEGKIEYRLRSDGGGNQSEFSRDQLGDSWNFGEADNEGYVDGGGATDNLTRTNGLLSIDMDTSASWGAIDLSSDPNIPADIYHTYEIRVEAPSEDTNLAIWDNVLGGVDYWTLEELNVSDFEDGTTEDWTAGVQIDSFIVQSGAPIGQSGQWLRVREESFDGFHTINATGLSIDSSKYNVLSFNIYPIENISQIRVIDSGLNEVGIWSNFLTKQIVQEVTINLTGSGWTGTETELRLEFLTSPAGAEGGFWIDGTILREVDPIVYGDIALSQGWQTVTLNVENDSDWTGIITNPIIRFYTDSGNFNSTNNEFNLDWINLFGNLDFFTHVESEIEDTLNFAESSDYFQDVLGDVSDFDDSTTEDWVGFGGSTAVNMDGHLNVTRGADPLIIDRNGMTIVSSTYKWFTMEFSSTVNLTTITMRDSGSADICVDSTGWIETQEHLFSCNLDDDADWTGTETGIQILFQFASYPASIFINFTYLYDVEFGDSEGFSGLLREFVNPNDFYHGTLASATDYVLTPTGLTLDTSFFDVGSFRVRSNDNLTVTPRISQIGGSVLSFGTSTILVAGVWTLIELDFSGETDWTTYNIDYFSLQLVDTGSFSGNESIDIQFLHILGHWEESSSVIGLAHPDTFMPVANVSIHFWRDPSVGARFEVLLLDLDGEISYYFFSDNITNIGDEWIRGKIEYSVLKSTFRVTMTWDNTSREFRVLAPGDFTSQSGRTPALFEIGKPPLVYISTYLEFGWHALDIDFVKAPFKEREWTQTTSSDVPSFTIQDNWNMHHVDSSGSILDGNISAWDLIVPSLDSVNVEMRLQAEDSDAGLSHSIIWSFVIFAVDGDDGEFHELFDVEMQHYQGGTGNNCNRVGISDLSSPPSVFNDFLCGSTANGFNSLLTFSMALTRDRSTIGLQVRSTMNESESSITKDGVAEIQIADVADDPSQEFVLRTILEVGKDGTLGYNAPGEEYYQIVDFGLMERDIIGDVAKRVVEPIANFLSDLFLGVFRFIAEIFKLVGDGISLAFGVFIDGLASLLSGVMITLAAGLELAMGLVTTAVEGIGVLLDASLGALGVILEAAIDALGPVIEGIGTIIELAVQALEPLLEVISDALIEIAADIWSAFISVVTDIIDAALTGLGIIFDALIAILQLLVDGVLTWILNLLNLTSTFNEVGSFLDFLIAIIFFVFAIGVFVLFSGAFLVSREPEDVLVNYWNIISFDMMFGMSFLGFRVYIPFAALMVVWIILMGYASTLFFVVPWA